MKKLLLTISASLLLLIGAKAQNLDLELWQYDTLSVTVQDPTGWTSFNTLTLLGMPQSVYKITNAPAFGAASAMIETRKVQGAAVPNPFRPGHPNFDTVGLLCFGKIHTFPSPGISFGQALPLSITRPNYLSFSSKDSVVAGDSSFVLAYLTKWGQPTPGKLDTIASGVWGESSTGSAGWANHHINMVYAAGTTGIVPDSQQIFVSSSIYSHGGAKMGSKYYVDAFCWDCNTGINEYNIENNVSVFPNPASNEINFSSSVDASYIEITDITGRKLGTYTMQNNKAKIHTEGFNTGFYMYTIINDKKVTINRGKFEVAR